MGQDNDENSSTKQEGEQKKSMLTLLYAYLKENPVFAIECVRLIDDKLKTLYEPYWGEGKQRWKIQELEIKRREQEQELRKAQIKSIADNAESREAIRKQEVLATTKRVEIDTAIAAIENFCSEVDNTVRNSNLSFSTVLGQIDDMLKKLNGLKNDELSSRDRSLLPAKLHYNIALLKFLSHGIAKEKFKHTSSNTDCFTQSAIYINDTLLLPCNLKYTPAMQLKGITLLIQKHKEDAKSVLESAFTIDPSQRDCKVLYLYAAGKHSEACKMDMVDASRTTCWNNGLLPFVLYYSARCFYKEAKKLAQTKNIVKAIDHMFNAVELFQAAYNAIGNYAPWETEHQIYGIPFMKALIDLTDLIHKKKMKNVNNIDDKEAFIFRNPVPLFTRPVLFDEDHLYSEKDLISKIIELMDRLDLSFKHPNNNLPTTHSENSKQKIDTKEPSHEVQKNAEQKNTTPSKNEDASKENTKVQDIQSKLFTFFDSKTNKDCHYRDKFNKLWGQQEETVGSKTKNNLGWQCKT